MKLSKPPRYLSLWTRIVTIVNHNSIFSGTLVILVGMIFSYIVLGDTPLYEITRLEPPFIKTKGVITEFDTLKTLENSASKYVIGYDYWVDTHKISNRIVKEYLYYEIGEQVTVWHHPKLVRESRLMYEESNYGIGSWLLMLVFLIPVLGFKTLIKGINEARYELFLLQYGIQTNATITKQKKIPAKDPDIMLYHYYFQYKAKGKPYTFEVEAKSSLHSILEANTSHPILYNPHQPNHQILLEQIDVIPQQRYDGTFEQATTASFTVFILPFFAFLSLVPLTFILMIKALLVVFGLY